MSRITRAIVPIAALSLLALAGCASGDDGAGSDEPALGTADNPVQLGVVGASDPYWDVYKEAVEAEDIAIDIVDFTEYSQPNPALTEGDLDINQFQHILFLAQYNEESGEDVQPIGATAIYPLGLYSDKYDSPDDIPDGETVLVPDDATNLARGLLVLQEAGLIALEDGGSAYSTPEDIIEDESRVEVETVAADLTLTSLPDVAAAIANNDYVTKAGIDPETAIAADSASDESALPYVNVFAVRSEDVDNEVLNKLVEIYQTNQDVQDGVLEVSGGTAVLAQTPADELQASLADTQEAFAASK
ncbi:MetQ/NlpA family ABC transporter substrate-binding protein [Microbacterium marinilacus]|uniref:MetQ/NlpA family ABC transporter substrate-binding protein n=1 Tax=Microbacterium marinilacus TaxID=415209 RepID=A0ABP7BTS5_9MICO|nr:MetQ/NlpA family ABC transporter substrate-binding protein [Microbacterium marinilacus]MBY0688222.1 methionine ABC transporter substrate-binding protein [Microbacterium marinilacus]